VDVRDSQRAVFWWVVLLVVSDIFGGTWGFYLGVNRVNLEKICGKPGSAQENPMVSLGQ